ncbi:lysozyme [Paraburkholderia caballeronis]|uniref:Lysozyme n=1 Tax=Paraburkholderia caballeronis TaxID=416943 RepID=A0A1H7L305_9BURK|nr:lysozyme [Paraburkholderia caballeronis]PXW28266.1 lysozyme [Paraburkholderia caballeronis]PXX03632.1 lysozyme [Paraburkholderia caballeronis]RAK04376.1 lysozyme [Paraburkholderia caballeronis]SED82717.1 lysozyme [Paraburkholderia caballeronis]SEK93180.1 lysozyme [Paraburkholderia caballeronis]
MPFRPQKKGLVAVIGATAAAAAISFTGGNEGVRLAPYTDQLGGGVQTVCFGETDVPMQRYTLPECKQILDSSLAGYASSVRAMTPGFDALTDGQKVAVIDFAYNAGLGSYRSSTLRRRYAAADFPAACDEFLKWRFTGGRDCSVASSGCTGIYTRRRAERAACLGE